MPTVITLVANSATPHGARFKLVGNVDGVAEVLSIDELAAALPVGPLKTTLLATPPTDVDHFNVYGARGNEIRIYDVAPCDADATVVRDGAYSITWVADASTALAGLSCNLENANTRIIEIRLNHSVQA